MTEVSQEKEICLLCKGKENSLFYEDQSRPYFQCSSCDLIFVPPQYHLNLEQEKHRYDFHQNLAEDLGYQKFLNKLVTPLSYKLKLDEQGLDFGCGPTPVLSMLLEKKGFSMKNYDPFYYPQKELLLESYNFLTCSEAIEHFSKPREEWGKFLRLVKKGGWIGIMTELFHQETNFAKWYYIRDETHICFYSKSTFQWLGEQYGLTPEFIGKSVILFQV